MSCERIAQDRQLLLLTRSLCLLPAFCLAFAGCSNKPTTALAQSAPPVVSVSQPVEKEITDYEELVGRTDAPESVEVRARVTGYLVEVPFKEGREVKAGDVLFRIDANPYQATLARAKALVKLAEARLKLARADYARAQEVAKTPGAISQQDLDKYAAQQDVADADLASGKASADSAQLDVDYCTVQSPLDGMVGRYLKTVGNIVTQDQTMLTTIVSVDPMYAYFDVDERTMLQVQQLIRTGKMKSARRTDDIPVWMGLASEEGFPHAGTVNFVNNRVDPTTGTLQVRGVFQNPIANDIRVLSPGLFVRVRVAIGEPYKALLINERAVGTDQGQKFVYVVNEKDEVEYRRVELGNLHDGLRVVKDGLNPGERIIVSGLQRVRQGSKVTPRLVEMPSPPKASLKSVTTAASTVRASAAQQSDQ